MRRRFMGYLSLTTVAISVMCWTPTLQAQHRGNLGNGGARGGGGARPSASSRPAPQARPSMPQPKLPSGGSGNLSRPNPSATRPSLPSARPNLPSMSPGGLSRPSPSTRPNPTPGARPNPTAPQNPITRPGPTTRPGATTRPGSATRPEPTPRPDLGARPGSTTRPDITRPGTLPGGGIVKPNVPTTKPAPRPGLGPNRPTPGPGLNDLPGDRPTTRPTGPLRPTTRPDGNGRPGGSGSGDLNRPNINPPITRPPVTKPALPNQRPSTKPGDRPNITPPTDNRPFPNRPDRPTSRPLPGDRPGISTKPAERPSLGGGNRPDFGGNNRPNRPDFGGENNRPNRPDFGGDNRPNRPNRPDFGGNNRPIIGGGNNNNIGNNININNNWNNNWNNININRPGWNNNWNNWNNNWNNWGGNWNNNQWGDYWYNNHVNHYHHSWYHGCWHGHWGGVSYRPVIWGASVWGLYGWGFQPTYINPYYVAPAVTTTPVYNYSQPVVVYNYSSTDNSSSSNINTTNAPPATDSASYGRFDESLQLFKAGNFRQALVACDDAITQNPNDPVMHEVRALIQFALGQYAPAAAVLNSLLASSPGMDWTTLSSLYDDVDTYTEQLRRLEDYCKSNPKDPAAQFVLAYHYMVAGYSEEAADVLKTVLELQPKDIVAKRLLESLTPPDSPENDTDENAAKGVKSTAKPANEPIQAEADAPTTDLVGSWKATEKKGTITLTIDEDFNFVWKAVNDGTPSIDLDGNLMIQGAMMILSNDQQGNLTGKVISGGPNKFTFVPTGSPEDYQGLIFERTSPSN